MVSHKMSLKLERGKEERRKQELLVVEHHCAAHDCETEKVECDLILEKVMVVFDLQI